MCPKNNPWAAKINENSPIWAKDNAVKNAGFFVYLNNEVIVMMINGFKKITKINKTNKGNHKSIITPGDKAIPKETKNNNEKKSLKLLILPIIS